jgi:hypothetical protein
MARCVRSFYLTPVKAIQVPSIILFAPLSLFKLAVARSPFEESLSPWMTGQCQCALLNSAWAIFISAPSIVETLKVWSADAIAIARGGRAGVSRGGARQHPR